MFAFLKEIPLIIKFFNFLKSLPIKWNIKIWLTLLTAAIIFLFTVLFNTFNIRTFLNLNMTQIKAEHRYTKHKIEKILEQALFQIGKDKKGTIILEVIETKNEGTKNIPNYRGYVMYLMEYDNNEKKVVTALERRLKNDKVSIFYDLAVSSAMKKYSLERNSLSSVYLSVDEMIKNIDKAKMEAMWKTETKGDNGKTYYGNFDFLPEGAAWAFDLNGEEIEMQIVAIIDKEYYENNKQDDYMKVIRDVRDEIKSLF